MSFSTYNPEDQVLSSDAIISPMWDDSTTVLTTFYTSSTQEIGVVGQHTQGEFFLDVWKDNPALSSYGIIPQFSIAYGHRLGSGSAYFNALVPDKTPTRDIYGQFRSLIFGDENTLFQFGDSIYTSDDIIVISVGRARFKESFNPGSFYLKLKSGSFSLELVDDSTVSSISTYIGTARVYQLLSGSYNSNTGVTTPYSTNYTISGSYGLMIPDEGLIILNPGALAQPGNTPLGGVGAVFNTDDPSTVATFFNGLGYTYNINNRMVYQMISSSAVGTSLGFALQNYETISSRYFFTRVKNADFNYTTNPSIIDANGNLLYTQLIYNPQTYITTVGLYNNSGDLLAVAKLNKPLVKDFTKELLLRVKLDF